MAGNGINGNGINEMEMESIPADHDGLLPLLLQLVKIPVVVSWGGNCPEG